jgi:hypothetical protein
MGTLGPCLTACCAIITGLSHLGVGPLGDDGTIVSPVHVTPETLHLIMVQFRLLVPCSSCGYLLGVGGSSIRGITAESVRAPWRCPAAHQRSRLLLSHLKVPSTGSGPRAPRVCRRTGSLHTRWGRRDDACGMSCACMPSGRERGHLARAGHVLQRASRARHHGPGRPHAGAPGSGPHHAQGESLRHAHRTHIAALVAPKQGSDAACSPARLRAVPSSRSVARRWAALTQSGEPARPARSHSGLRPAQPRSCAHANLAPAPMPLAPRSCCCGPSWKSMRRPTRAATPSRASP